MSCVDGVGARVGGSLFVGLGSTARHWYALDLAAPAAGWRRCADFPAAAPSCAAAAALGGRLHLFGGFGRASATANTAQFDTAYRYAPAADRWEPSLTRLPRGLDRRLGNRGWRVEPTSPVAATVSSSMLSTANSRGPHRPKRPTSTAPNRVLTACASRSMVGC